MRESIRGRFALSERGWANLVGAVRASMVTDAVLMMATVVAVLFTSDIMGIPGHDPDIPYPVYIMLCAVLIILTAVAYRREYDRCFLETYRESGEIRIGLAERIRHLPLSFLAERDPSDLTVRMLGDVTVQEGMMSHWVPAFAATLVFTPVVALVAVLWSPVLGLAMVWPVPVAVGLALASSRVHRDNSVRRSRAMGRVSAMIRESMDCSNDLRVNGCRGRYMDRLSAELDDVEGVETRTELAVALTVALTQTVLRLGAVTTALIGIVLLAEGAVSLTVFVTSVIVASRINDPLVTALQNHLSILAGEVSCRRVAEVSEMAVQAGGTDFSPEGTDLVFEDVRFSYGGDRTVLDGVSFTARGGCVTALVGPSGSGKTTVARLATRFWDADSGRITVGGVDVSDVDPEVLMSRFSVVFQDVVLFNTSVMENIRMGRRDATDDEVLAAAEAAMCDGFVSRLPDGYGTVIGENGAMLSGGERQRVSIARAILKDAPIVIMDEATASLDAGSESRVQDALSHLVEGRTVLVIAHRMRTVTEADHVVVLRDGRVVEQGPPAELLASGGEFSRMAGVQSASGGWSIRGGGAV